MLLSVKLTSILPILFATALLFFYWPKIAFAKCTFEDNKWLVGIFFRYGDDIRSNCSGVIIHKDWVLAVYQDCLSLDRVVESFPRDGRLSVIRPNGDKRGIVELVRHYRFYEEPMFNNFVLAKVRSSFGARPIKLPPRNPDDCTKATLLQHRVVEKKLTCLRYDVLDMEQCNQTGAFRVESVICARTKNKKSGAVVIPGNVLVCNDEPETIIGVVTSRAPKDFAKHRGIELIRISYYVEFINMTINDNWRSNSSAVHKTTLLLSCLICLLVYRFCTILS